MTHPLPSPFRAALAVATVTGALAVAPGTADAIMPAAAPLAGETAQIQPIQYYYAPPPRYYAPPPPRGYYYPPPRWRRPPPAYYAPPPPPPRYYAPPPGVGLYYRY
ncbi:hypothetical protein [Roseomonas xinghualingensis]|uniref:hypothetical protein n=1 Tax=Roseomonas xinghualingensis TaxID=2986475 RepID=UPI0021F1078F|nr:hypothetical protein [Roseomonas sp. SXEYE001]MCV4209296.1 hypothetical protein [Roseomonas sp. SXEYE001]